MIVTHVTVFSVPAQPGFRMISFLVGLFSRPKTTTTTDKKQNKRVLHPETPFTSLLRLKVGGGECSRAGDGKGRRRGEVAGGSGDDGSWSGVVGTPLSCIDPR